MKRLLKALNHGIQTRQAAIIYINGKVIQASNHLLAIKQYLESNPEIAEEIIDEVGELEGLPTNEMQNIKEEYKEYGEVPPELFVGFSEFDRMDKMEHKLDSIPLAFAHLVLEDPETGESVKDIFVESESLQNVDLQTVANAMKQQYPDFNIYDDDDCYYDDEQEKNIFKRLAKLHKILK